MHPQIIESVQAILKKEGFSGFSVQGAPHSLTLSAERSNVRAVFHMTDQDEQPLGSGHNTEVPSSTMIRLKASLPGAALTYNESGRFGAGGAPSSRPEEVTGVAPGVAVHLPPQRGSPIRLRDDRTRG